MKEEGKEEVFYCPYCGKVKDRMELNYNTELGGFRPTIEKLGVLRDVYDYQHQNYEFTKYEVPMCDDCLIIHQEANSKAVIVALCFFVPIAFYLLFLYQDFWNFMIPVGLVGIVCLLLWWIVKVFLIKRHGIRYHAHKYAQYSTYNDYFTQYTASNIEEIERNLQEDKKKRELELRETEASANSYDYIAEWNKKDFGKIKNKLEEGSHNEYEDENFEGHFES